MFAWMWGSSSLLIRSSLLRPVVIVVASLNRAFLRSDIVRQTLSAFIPPLDSFFKLIVMMLDNGAFFKREGNLQHIATSSSSANPLNTPLHGADCPPSVRELFPADPQKHQKAGGMFGATMPYIRAALIGNQRNSAFYRHLRCFSCIVVA